MPKPTNLGKQPVWCDVYVQGVFTRTVGPEKRTVYQKPDGSRFVRVQDRQELLLEKDGKLHYESRYWTVKVENAMTVMSRILQRAKDEGKEVTIFSNPF